VKVLAIETSSPCGSVALLEDDHLVAEEDFGEGARHARALLPSADRVLDGRPEAVGLVAVSAGPGSYTGLRVGLTLAKTFAIQTETPVVGVSSLDVIAANAAEPRRLGVVVDARLGQVYAALYDEDGKKVLGDIAASPEDVAARVAAGPLVIGAGLTRYGDVFARAGGDLGEEGLWRPRAAHAGRLGRARFEAEGGEDPHALLPRYLRRPQAEVRWEESQNAPGPKST